MVDVEAAASSRRWRAGAAALDSGATATLWCRDAACHSLGGNLGRGGRLGRRASEEAIDF
jgi:hypothetical protein